MFPYTISLFGLQISLYGVFVALGILTAYFLLLRLAKKEGLPEKAIENTFLIAVISGLIGSRIFYVVEHSEEFNTPLDWIAFWKGGVVFYGGLIGGIIGALIGIRLYNLPLWKSADLAALAVPLAHFFGRLGCTSVGCCYGKPFPHAESNEVGLHFTDKFPFFYVVFPKGAIAPPYVPLYPTQIMEAIGNLLIFFALVYAFRRKPFHGFVFSLYLLLYGTERFFLEFFRGVTPPIEPIGLTWNQLVSLVLIFGSVLLMFLLRKEREGLSPS